MDARYSALVAPFYLEMMRTNACESGAALVPAIVGAARSYAAEDVVGLLNRDWRERVMGAWLALLYDDAEVTTAVLDALATSLGSLDAPPLTIAAVVLAGKGALTTLAAYTVKDAESGWGACGFVAAAIEYLDGSPSACEAADRDSSDFAALLAVAEQLRATR